MNGLVETDSDLDLDLQREFLEAFKMSHCNVSVAMNRTGIDRGRFYAWRTRSEGFSEALEHIREGLIDIVESKLIKAIKNDNFYAIRFFLETVGKNRGYARSGDFVPVEDEFLGVETSIVFEVNEAKADIKVTRGRD